MKRSNLRAAVMMRPLALPLLLPLLLPLAIACGRPLVPAAPASVPEPVPAATPERPTPAAPATPTAPPTTETPPASPAAAAAPSATLLAPPPVTREFRGVWVASVANIDWPSKRTLGTVTQQRELLELLDRAVALRLNAVLLQVRPAADALYASKIEPWSEYLTGAQGRAPDPYWDPLEFAVREAHARGLELHAWFNPYRARHTDAKSPLHSSHIGRTNPELVKPYAGYLWMDPGEPQVRARTLRVVLDVVRRYDIDGVHIDDYFYPYPENNRRGAEIPFPDDRSWERYRRNGGLLDRGDWRRANVDSLVRELNFEVHRVKPWVRFGISPFGIWQPGYPEGVRGLNAYAKLYADARKWLREGWLDYFTPQLYWPTTKPEQSYAGLLKWWVGENYKGRHIWAGNFTSRAGAPGASAFPVSELLKQIAVSRAQPGSTGNVHFSMISFTNNQGGMNDALVTGPYAAAALPPASPWLTVPAPSRPVVRVIDADGRAVVTLATQGREAPWQWLVRYRTSSGWQSRLLQGTVSRWTLPSEALLSPVWVQSLNRAGTESAPVQVVP
ncbi:MAG TPA: family 10 glycosylhydrolase, partial [Gemmatimonas sp.]|nr:family 10 glycosylhydrolase [Gemmatimonas sp.]